MSPRRCRHHEMGMPDRGAQLLSDVVDMLMLCRALFSALISVLDFQMSTSN